MARGTHANIVQVYAIGEVGHPLHGPGIRRGPEPARTTSPARARRRCRWPEHHAPGRRRPATCQRAGHHPSRHQAREHLADAAGARSRSPTSACRASSAAISPGCNLTAKRRHHGHAPVHESRAGRGQGQSIAATGHLLPRRHRLPHDGGPSAFSTAPPPFEVAVQHVQKEPHAACQRSGPTCPEALCAIIHKMMAKDPGRRYQTGRELQRTCPAWRKPRFRLRPAAGSSLEGLTASDSTPVSEAATPMAEKPRGQGVTKSRPPGRRRWLLGLAGASLLCAPGPGWPSAGCGTGTPRRTAQANRRPRGGPGAGQT